MCGAGAMGLTQWGCPIGWNELCGAGPMDVWGRLYVWGRPYGAGAMGLTQWGCPIGWNELCGAGCMCGAGPMGQALCVGQALWG